MWPNATNAAFTLFICAAVVGLVSSCATDKDRLLPSGNASMMDVWHMQTSESSGSLAGRRLLDARLALRRPVGNHAEDVLEAQFQRLPNPDLVMYVYPHMAAGNAAPIPGYSTVFPMFQNVQYAMPGEGL
jgi:conjugative transfer region lipoprotein (TIGR03751 family)